MTLPGAREFAIALAQEAGHLLLNIRLRGLNHQATRAKRGFFDIVTEADVASERFIADAIGATYPGHGLYAEESAQGHPPDVEWLWIVDPVDGTTNYSHGLPLFAVNLALSHWGAPVLGVTHDPSAGRTYWAETGGGAWVRHAGEDRPIRVSTTADLEHALLATGFVHARIAGPTRNRAEFHALDLQTQAVRRLGSAAIVMAWIASGYLEGYWEADLKPWDVAAGCVLIKEAGGALTQYDGSRFGLDSRTMVASNGRPGVHQPICDTLARIRAG